eukprot:COSAG06_NODE_14603_length_1144_cov_0.780861_1_plen_122_part_00
MDPADTTIELRVFADGTVVEAFFMCVAIRSHYASIEQQLAMSAHFIRGRLNACGLLVALRVVPFRVTGVGGRPCSHGRIQRRKLCRTLAPQSAPRVDAAAAAAAAVAAVGAAVALAVASGS